MITVGIVANPASGTDIRRLVAYGSNYDNAEKTNIVRRVLLGLEAVGVERVLIMPDSFGIGRRALDDLSIELEASLLPIPLTFTKVDSTRAARVMATDGAGCIVTIGGDGTNRAVAKASGKVPLMPISTGTNNVFPTMIEGTIAGMAAGLAARRLVDSAVHRMPRLEIFHLKDSDDSRDIASFKSDPPDDIALVDAAVYDERFVASRAVWDVSKIIELFLTRAVPGNIGLSAIGAHVPRGNGASNNSKLPGSGQGQGLYLRLDSGGKQVLAPIAPGLIQSVGLAECRPLQPGDVVTVNDKRPCVLALDGEREIELRPGSTAHVRLSPNGPWVVDAHEAMEVSARAGIFVRD